MAARNERPECHPTHDDTGTLSPAEGSDAARAGELMADVAVRLVAEYLQSCGYFVQTEVPVRTHERGQDLDITDLDIIAVWLPGHAPTAADDSLLAAEDELIDIIIGEVKQGKARLNAGLFQTESIEHALRIVGCCPEAEVPNAARKIARGMRLRMDHAGYTCRVRCVAFAGRGYVGRTNVLTVRLGDCAIALSDAVRRDGLAGAAPDSITGLLQLLAKGDPDVTLEHGEAGSG